MRIAEVIGSVTLSRVNPTLAGYRWLIGVPFSLKALDAGSTADGEDVVIFDSLGAGIGNRIGFSEGGEAAAPFHPQKRAIDAYCACILDQVSVTDRRAVEE